jgi:uncharacterized membrane protein
MDEFAPRLGEYAQREATEDDLGELDGSVPSRSSGYIRFVDADQVLRLAKENRIRVRIERRVGHFVPEGFPLMTISRSERMTEDLARELLAAFDIGPTRTLQQDVEFGVIQIVDIALRAISPAVNDPSTAISCVDQLSRILIRWLHRAPPSSHLYAPPHILRVIVPWISTEALLDTAFEQIRHYSESDVAVSLRLLRALDDIARTTTEVDLRSGLVGRARRVVAGCTGRLRETELGKLQRRLAVLESRIHPGA